MSLERKFSLLLSISNTKFVVSGIQCPFCQYKDTFCGVGEGEGEGENISTDCCCCMHTISFCSHKDIFNKGK